MSESTSSATEPAGGILPRALWPVGALLFLSLAWSLWLPAARQSLWLDEAGSLAQVSAPDFWQAARQDVHPPLYYLLLRGAHGLTTSIELLRFVSVACASALLLLAAWSVRGSPAALTVAGLFTALSPELVKHAAELRPYALLYFLLGGALLAAIALARGQAGPRLRILLALLLLGAASTHLVTIFFLPALLPLLLASARPPRFSTWLAATWPLAPAFLAALAFKFAFITQPKDLAGGWWLGAPDSGAILRAFSEAFGWDNITWLGDTVARKWSLPGMLVPTLGALLAALTLGVAWHHGRDRLGWQLLGAAVLAATALIAYSFCFESVILPRTVLPGLLPFFAWLAWAIGRHPSRRWRIAAVTAFGGYSLLAVTMPARVLQLAPPGLRELAAATQAHYAPGDLIVTTRGLEMGLRPYWPALPAGELWPFHADAPSSRAGLETRLESLPPAARVWLVHRDDYYSRQAQDRATVSGLLERQGYAVREIWSSADLFLLLAEPPAHRP